MTGNNGPVDIVVPCLVLDFSVGHPDAGQRCARLGAGTRNYVDDPGWETRLRYELCQREH